MKYIKGFAFEIRTSFPQELAAPKQAYVRNMQVVVSHEQRDYREPSSAMPSLWVKRASLSFRNSAPYRRFGHDQAHLWTPVCRESKACIVAVVAYTTWWGCHRTTESHLADQFSSAVRPNGLHPSRRGLCECTRGPGPCEPLSQPFRSTGMFHNWG